MKKIIMILIVALVLFSCDSNKHYYGLLNPEQKMPDVEYQISPTNVICSIIFVETLAVPVYVVGWALYESVDSVE
jgi:hypothetical protein